MPFCFEKISKKKKLKTYGMINEKKDVSLMNYYFIYIYIYIYKIHFSYFLLQTLNDLKFV